MSAILSHIWASGSGTWPSYLESISLARSHAIARGFLRNCFQRKRILWPIQSPTPVLTQFPPQLPQMRRQMAPHISVNCVTGLLPASMLSSSIWVRPMVNPLRTILCMFVNLKNLSYGQGQKRSLIFYFLSFFSKPSDYFLRKKNILKELKVINEELTAHRCQKTTV